jgi:Ni2+-binding GTPase involved in maturation of urease and hydrogenase
MKTAIVAGTPGSGKTAVLLHTLKELLQSGKACSIVKFDCLYTDDDARFKKLGVPVMVGLAKDMCPDHFAIYNYEEIFKWAKGQKSDILVVETAGLCHRCAPYTKNSLGICVLDATTGPNTPLKLGPFLSTPTSPSSRRATSSPRRSGEIFRERILEINPHCTIIEANGLSGKGSTELAEKIKRSHPVDIGSEQLRHTAPAAICTLCVGESRISKSYHRGLLRNMDGMQYYEGE